MKPRLLLSLLLLSGTRVAFADPQADLQAVVGTTMTNGVAGSALVVDDPALGHFAVASGVADRATGRALQASDRFRIASISKTFTAAAIMLLRDEGRVDLDATLRTYLPEHNIPNAGVITLRMLLTHTSGLPDHNNDSTEFGAMIAANPDTTFTPQQVFELVRRLPAHFAPGAAWSYCDTGYYILRLVVEKRNAQGLSFSQFIQNRLLTPWALANTFVPGPENGYLYNIPGSFSRGYVIVGPGISPPDVTGINQSWDAGCGGMVSTVGDLARWVRVLYSGQVLSARSTADLKTITMQSRALGRSYGMATAYQATTGFGHGGATAGYFCLMQYEPVHQTASAVFINTTSDELFDAPKALLVAAKRALGYPEQADPGYARLANGSGRGLAGTGEDALVLGFTFGGAETKSIIVRAAGPMLRSFGVASALADPRVQLSSRGVAVATNDNWDGRAETTAAFTQNGAFLFPPGSKDAAVVATLTPGNYSATITSVDGSSGVALAEVYDAHARMSAPSRMNNFSVRGRIGAGEQVLAAGFSVLGDAPLRVLIRGVGPALAGLGVASPAIDPQIELYSGQTVVAQNDNWDGAAGTAALFASTGAFTLPAGSKDAALVATLNPGAYTVLLRGATTTASGVALIEVYDAQPAPDYAATRQLVSDYVRQRMQETGVVGVSVALVDSDGVILQDGFGYCDPAKTKPATADTQFSIGSLTKTIAAMSILQLVAEGKLDLDAPLTAYLPTFSVRQRFPSAPITLRSILAHHSGLPGDLKNGAGLTAPGNRWNDYVLNALAQEYTERPVGEMWAYNNSGYVLLQNVIENASGLSLADYSRRLFFGPAGMDSSTFGFDAPAWTTGFMAGQPVPTEYLNAGTAGSIKSSAADMARYLRLLIHEGLGDRGRVLAPSVFRGMLARQYPDDPFDAYGGETYGLGFQLNSRALGYAGSSFGHPGATAVFHSQLLVLKDQGLAVFVSSNTVAPGNFAEEVSLGILRIALQQLRGLAPPAASQPTPAAIVTKTRAELQSYAGLYAPGFGGYDRIVATDRGLQWTLAAGGTAPKTHLILPLADGRFAPETGGPLQIEFKTIAGRSVIIWHLTNDGWTDDSIFGEKLTVAPLSPAWQQRTGDYVWVNLPANNYDSAVFGKAATERVRLETRDGVVLFNGEVIMPASDTLAFTAGIGNELGRNRGDAIRVETGGGIETIWHLGKAARLATLPLASYTYPDPADFGAFTWTAAFEATHAKFSREYAFGDWKSIDWLGLYNRFRPRIAQAQVAGDEKAYYLALHEYVCSIPDGHLSLSAENGAVPLALAKELAGGGFGMAIAELDDGRAIAAAVIPNGQAASAGIVAGAEIITWGGQPVRTAIGRIDVGAIPYKLLTGAVGNESPMATLEHYRLEQARLLTRGPVGTSVTVGFKNSASVSSQTASLTAVDDGGQTFSLVNFAKKADFSDQIDYRILPEGYGYVLIRMEHDMSSEGGYPIRLFNRFREAIASFVAARVPGVIVDLRGNFGGSDELSANLSGFFYSTPSFYESQAYYDKRNGQFLGLTLDDRPALVENLTINPQTPYFGGLVVALVNPGTISSGEGPAAAIARLPNGRVIGFHGTNGSFGMVGGNITLPGGYGISYPFGRSLGQNGVVQLDSRNGVGGVAPNPRVPKTLENVLAFAAGTDVELKFAIENLRGRM